MSVCVGVVGRCVRNGVEYRALVMADDMRARGGGESGWRAKGGGESGWAELLDAWLGRGELTCHEYLVWSGVCVVCTWSR